MRHCSRRRPLVAVQQIAVDLVLVELTTAAEEPAPAVGAALHIASEVVQPASIDAAITAASSRPLEEECNARAVQRTVQDAPLNISWSQYLQIAIALSTRRYASVSRT